MEPLGIQPPSTAIQGVVRALTSGKTTPVDQAAVYVSDLPALTGTVEEKPVVLTFQQGAIVPAHACVRVGQPLVVKMEGNELHHVVVRSRFLSEGCCVSPLSSAEVKYVFSRPEECVLIGCSIHFRESAYVTVVPNSCFALTDARGAFQLPQALPPGTYTLRVYHKDYGRGEKQVIVTKGQRKVDVEMDLPSSPK